ncbi:MAG: 2-oxoacid:acceptor oxidoreductase family protein [Candidatus Omnitrophica bacterium]|nr:2-oxoacid:acceptor oxidoreductase family protein [Candidatus Omnitrophota bacterium]
MLEVRWHGRGGQGAKTAAQFLAEAALELGKQIQSFPEYGPERAGAPIRTYTRIDDKPITIHCSVKEPEVVVVIDPTLLNTVDVTEGLKEDGILLVNSAEEPKVIREKLKFNKGKVATVDATKISLETLGIPMPNTPMLGALEKVKPLVSIDKLIDKIKAKFLKKIGEEKTNANIEGIKRAYEETKIG